MEGPVPTSLVQMWVPRVELHLFYNTIVFIPMVVAMYYHMFPTGSDASDPEVYVQLGAWSRRVGVIQSPMTRRPRSSPDEEQRAIRRLAVAPRRAFAAWRHARTALQLVLLCVASVLVLHGLFGPPVAPANLATVLTWVQYRGWLVIVLLAAGNFFCTGCPFVLVRDAGRRLWKPARRGRAGFAPSGSASRCSSPSCSPTSSSISGRCRACTAWLVLAYFAAALTVDLLFTGATFCKYLCPIGQFNFVASTMSPLEVQVRQPGTCRTCRTVDCIKGRRDEAVPARSCAAGASCALPSCQGREPRLHVLPRLRARVSARQRRNRDTRARRSNSVDAAASIGHRVAVAATRYRRAGARVRIRRSGQRPRDDRLPARAMEQGLAQILGARTEGPVLAVLFAFMLVGIPLVLMTSAAALTAWVTGETDGAPSRHRHGLRLRADSAWCWRVAGALRISLAHRGPDGHSGRANRRNRRFWAGRHSGRRSGS